MRFQLKYRIRKPFENKELEIKTFGLKTWDFSTGTGGLINHVLAKRFINPGGPPAFKLQKKWEEEVDE